MFQGDEAAYVDIGTTGFFVAEQVGVPALFAELCHKRRENSWKDHAFHEFSSLVAATFEDCQLLKVSGSLSALLKGVLRRQVTAWKIDRVYDNALD